MKPIKVVNNFLSEKECSVLIGQINKIIKDQIHNFSVYQDGKRLALAFGKDLYHEHNSHLNLNIISESEALFRKYFSAVVDQTAKLFNENFAVYEAQASQETRAAGPLCI